MSEINQKLDNATVSFGMIIDYLFLDWKVILLGGFLGLILGGGLAISLPVKYKASLLLKLPEDGYRKPIVDSNNLERRIKYYQYDSRVVESCGFLYDGHSGSRLSKIISVNSVRGNTNTVELELFSQKPEIGISCMNSIVDFISDDLMSEVNPYLLHAASKLEFYNQKVKDIEKYLSKQTSNSSDKYHLLPKIIAFEARISELEDYIFLTNESFERMKKMVNKNLAVTKISPSIMLYCMFGFFFGMFGVVLRGFHNRMGAK